MVEFCLSLVINATSYNRIIICSCVFLIQHESFYLTQDTARSQLSVQSDGKQPTLPPANDIDDRIIVPVSALETAIRHCERFLNVKSHQDIDHGTMTEVRTGPCVTHRWYQFMFV